MLPVSPNTFAVSCPKSCRWVGPACPLVGTGCSGTLPSCLCHVLHPPSLEPQRCKEKNLTSSVHCMEGSLSSLSPHFSHPLLGTLLATPSAFLLLSAATAISARSTQRLHIQAQPGIAHSTHWLILIHVPVGQWPSCLGATPSPREASGTGEMV